MNRRQIVAGSIAALLLALLAGLAIVGTRPLPTPGSAPTASESTSTPTIAAEKRSPAPIAPEPAARPSSEPTPAAEETPSAETPRELSLLDRLKSAEVGWKPAPPGDDASLVQLMRDARNAPDEDSRLRALQTLHSFVTCHGDDSRVAEVLAAMRDAAKWDDSPLIRLGAARFLARQFDGEAFAAAIAVESGPDALRSDAFLDLANEVASDDYRANLRATAPVALRNRYETFAELHGRRALEVAQFVEARVALETDDTVKSSGLSLLRRLAERAAVSLRDPAAIDQARRMLGDDDYAASAPESWEGW